VNAVFCLHKRNVQDFGCPEARTLVERPSPMAKTVQLHLTLCVKTDEWLGRAQTCTTGVLGPPTHQCHSFTAEIELPFARLAVPERMFLCCGGI